MSHSREARLADPADPADPAHPYSGRPGAAPRAHRAAEQDRAVPAPAAMAVGTTALLRIAQLPATEWTAAGSPWLFADADALVAEERDLMERARRLSARLGGEVVPDERLTAAERRAVLALRRGLRAGVVPTSAAETSAGGDAAGGVARVSPALARELVALARRSASLADGRGQFEGMVAAERARVGALLLSRARTLPALRAAVETASPGLLADLGRCADAGEPWDGKRLRNATAALWRALGRAALRTAPGTDSGQLATVPLECAPQGGSADTGRAGCAPVGAGPVAGGPDGSRLLREGARLLAFAAQTTENVHTLWATLRDLDLGPAPADTLLALAPLHHTARDGGLRCAVVGPETSGWRLREVTLPGGPALDAVRTTLAEGARTLAETEAALAGVLRDSARPAMLRVFLTHLLRLGVLQVCAAPAVRLFGWTPVYEAAAPSRQDQRDQQGQQDRQGPSTAAVASPARTARAARHAVSRGRCLDSYRSVDAAVGAGAAERVAYGTRLAARLAALRDAARAGPPPGWQLLDEARSVGPEPRSVVRILADHHLGDGDPPPGPQPGPRPSGWPQSVRPGAAGSRGGAEGAGYARLLAHIARHLGEEQVDVDGALLDEFGAPPVPRHLTAWPVDCLLRPLPGPGAVAVLESVTPAGTLDARFADTLRALHGGYPAARAYRAFLAAVERAARVRFVEVLVPPLDGRAANAVRRPVTTSWCTGDPNTGLYYGRTPHPPRHLPLDRITLRRQGGTLVAEAAGERILPVYHATRAPAPPYDRLLRLLLGAGHPAASPLLRLDGLAHAFPDAVRVPRLTVGGALVVSPAQWRVPRAALWRHSEPEAAKVAALAALRRSAALPRFGFVRARPGAAAVPVDFAALPAVQTLERLCASAPAGADAADLLIEEALPSPGQPPPLRDALHDGAALTAQLVLRLPYDRTPDQLARRAAAVLDGG
ncbi:lantibiotic dehydratase [Streptomyces boncukensis]|uniref:Lantibiotic dehydratase N-terminal domain-containing protein n=1 Tax=Streptomyces boncukensis TaxID=2711219 RepID=A0A6G4WYL2_9ACTN|nr:lantibiotic dehydratase [Streptomyces boncukensis]NGO70093.1 hypothetical protein [Streptomyces boncukensis]